MNAEDKTRLEELKLRIWKHQAHALLQGKKETTTILQNEIEGHRGRLSKALRLLTDGGYIRYRGKTKGTNSWDSEKSVYEILKFEEESAAFGEAPVFPTTWQELLNSTCSSFNQKDACYGIIGYVPVKDLKAQNAIYAWWHKDLYDFDHSDNKGEGYHIYPKALQDTRVKAILRAQVEKTLSDTYHNRLEKLLGLPQNSLPCIDNRNPTDGVEDDDPDLITVKQYTDIRYRNCGFTPAIFNTQQTASLAGEYEYWVKYFATLTDTLRKFDEKVMAAGGYEPLLKQMRVDIIEEKIALSPLNMCIQPKEGGTNEKGLLGAATRFMLKYSAFFDYDTLYGEDASVVHIDDTDVDDRFVSEFKPEEGDSKIVSKFKKEMLDVLLSR